MRIRQKAILLLALFSLLHCLNLIQSTYAKYRSEANASANISIARWNILVNNQDIKNNKDFSTMITPIFEGTDHIAPNVIAPTSTGYFDIVINSANVDVSFTYNISVGVSADSAVKDLKITGYSVDNGSIVSLNTSSYSIDDSVSKNDTKRLVTYRFYVVWDDSSSASMSNQEDTNATKNSQKAIFDVHTSFIQSTK